MHTTLLPVRALRLPGRLPRVLLLLSCLVGSAAQAQTIKPFVWHLDFSGHYSFVRTNFSGSGGEFNVNGGSASVNYYLNPRLSVLGDFGVYRFHGQPYGITSTLYTYTFGPRYTFRRFRFGVPYVHALIGGGRYNASSGSIQAGENGMVAALGGGFDLPITHQLDLRIIQADYLLTRFARADQSSGTQNNIRLSAGIVFRIAER